jgi:broad specificity phosphatase PhoE
MTEIESTASPDSAAAPETALKRIFLIRHAEANEGDKDSDRGRHLTELGKHQAQALASRVAGWQLDAIFCSDMHRACETAAAIAAHHPGIACVSDPVFRELSARLLEQELDAPDPALQERLESAWQRIITMPHAVSAIVTHSGLIKYLIGRTIRFQGGLKPRFHSDFTGVTALTVRSQGRALLQFFNDTRHLTPELVAGDKQPWFEDPTTGRWVFPHAGNCQSYLALTLQTGLGIGCELLRVL